MLNLNQMKEACLVTLASIFENLEGGVEILYSDNLILAHLLRKVFLIKFQNSIIDPLNKDG